MARCPKCDRKLHIWDIKAECPDCGVNIANYDWENRLEQDAIEAEIAFAKLRESVKRFKYAMVGTKLRIARIPVSVLPLFSFLLPLGTMAVSIPFWSEKLSLNAITLVMNILEIDIGGFIKLPASEIIGDSGLMLVIALALVILSALSLLVSLVFLLTNFKNFKSKGLFVTNFIASVMMIGSSVCFNRFGDIISTTSLADALQAGPSWGVYVSAALFLASAAINLAVSLAPVELPQDEEAKEKEETTVEA